MTLPLYVYAAAAGLLLLAAVYALGKRHARQRAKSEAATAKLKTIKEVRGYERQAETQDDDALVARLTRKP